MNKLISNCPLCEERALHVLSDDDKQVDNQQCINCGYVTSHLFKLDGNKKEDIEKYNSLTDDMRRWSKAANDRIWIPTIMTLPFGMLYPTDVEVVNEEDSKKIGIRVTENVMKWAFALMVDIPEEEQKNYPIPEQKDKFYTQKYDTDNRKMFDEFLYALSELNEKIKNENKVAKRQG